MGATTTISVFHHDRYRSCVVPAVRDLLRSGELGPWLATVWEHRQSRYPATAGRPFAFEPNGNDEVQLDADLVPTPVFGEEWFYLPARHTRERENLIDLFQHVIEGCCLSESVVTGDYSWLQFPYEFEERPELTATLWQLGNSTLVWNDGSGGFSEGIRGWLNPEQTAVLARELHRFTLPDREPDAALVRTSPDEYYTQRDLFRLFRIREMADRAWGMGQGVLCGNDLELHDRAGARGSTTRTRATRPTRCSSWRGRSATAASSTCCPMLADALQDAGCENDVVLTHCRDANEHTDACWVADLILASERPAIGGS